MTLPARTMPKLAARAAAGALTSVVAVSTAVALAPMAQAATTIPTPQAPTGLPSTVEGFAPYVGADSCDGIAKPGTVALEQLLSRTYPGIGYSDTRTCGTDAIISTSEHYDGRAIDWNVTVRQADSKKLGDAFVQWAVGKDAQGVAGGNARRLGISYLIWNNKQWVSWNSGAGWQPYNNCANLPGTGYDGFCHRNHVHITLSWAGAMKRTSWWTKQVAANDYGPCRSADLNWSPGYAGFQATRCPSYAAVAAEPGSSALHRSLVLYSGITMKEGDNGPVVRAIQQLVGVGVDGGFGPMTNNAVVAWQRAHGLVADGIVGVNTWRAALKATAPAAPTATAPAAQAPKPPANVAPPKVTAPTPIKTEDDPPAAKAAAYSKYYRTTLRYGSRGSAVKVAQRALRGLTVDGIFGRATRSKVAAFERNEGLRADGVIDAQVWQVLGHDYSGWSKVTLRYGSRGGNVKVLQAALGGLKVDGIFGRATQGKVTAFQQRHRMHTDGVMSRAEWLAL